MNYCALLWLFVLCIRCNVDISNYLHFVELNYWKRGKNLVAFFSLLTSLISMHSLSYVFHTIAKDGILFMSLKKSFSKLLVAWALSLVLFSISLVKVSLRRICLFYFATEGSIDIFFFWDTRFIVQHELSMLIGFVPLFFYLFFSCLHRFVMVWRTGGSRNLRKGGA